MSSFSTTGKFAGGYNVNAVALSIGQAEYTDRIGGALRAAAQNHPDGLKGLARAANSNIRAVEAWIAKRSTPNGLHLLRLMATIPEVQAECRRLAAMEANLDPEFERELSSLFLIWTRMKGTGA